MVTKLLSEEPMRAPGEIEWLLLILATAEMVVALSFCRKPEPVAIEDNSLYPERKYDLERIRAFITEFDLLGVNAGWGKGKTFLMERLKADKAIKDQFEIIQINLLSCDLDAVELLMVEELEKVFQKNWIYPENSRHLKSLLRSSKWGSALLEQVEEKTTGLTASFDGLRQELKLLPKKVLVIFEDIDRINDPDTIKKVFAISEHLSGERLHVIFQYDMQVLEKIGFDRKYLEKYIPYTVNLTDIPYEKLVEYSWGELNMSETPIKMEKVRSMCHDLPGLYEFNHFAGLRCGIPISIGEEASARKVQFFLSELKKIVLENNEFTKPGNLETVCAVMFIKHFFSETYQQLNIGLSPLQSLFLEFEKGRYPLPQLLDKLSGSAPKERQQKLEKIMNDVKNRGVVGVVLLLGYDLKFEQRKPVRDEILTESVLTLKQREKNEKIDRIVWNVLANGTSELTDMENAIRKLFCDVLSKSPGQAQNQAWETYKSDMFYGRRGKDNQTVFRIGLDPFFSLFQAMAVIQANEEQWMKFLAFYFSQYQQKSISGALVDNLKYCNLRSKKVFFQVICFFNSLAITGNLNQDESYNSFVKECFEAAVSLGYSEKMESWMFQWSETISENVSYAEEIMEDYQAELKKSKEQYEKQSFSYVAEEFDNIIRFVSKNLEMIHCEKSLPERGFSGKTTETQSRWIHQEEIDRLEKIRGDTQNLFWSELKNTYQEGKILFQEWKAMVDRQTNQKSDNQD